MSIIWDYKEEIKKCQARIQVLSDQRDEHLESAKKLKNAIYEQDEILQHLGIHEGMERLAKEAEAEDRWQRELEAYQYEQLCR